jgi:calcium/calmodulin-dependent protein kinase I
LTDHLPSDEHDLSNGIRENWHPRKQWKATLNSVIASQRFAKGGAARSRARAASSAADSTEEGYHTGEEGSEDEEQKQMSSQEQHKKMDALSEELAGLQS